MSQLPLCAASTLETVASLLPGDTKACEDEIALCKGAVAPSSLWPLQRVLGAPKRELVLHPED